MSAWSGTQLYSCQPLAAAIVALCHLEKNIRNPRRILQNECINKFRSTLTINGAAVEQVSRTTFLRVNNNTLLAKKAQQHLYFIHKLERAGAPSCTPTKVAIESISSSCITVWFWSCTVSIRKTLHRIVNTAERFICASLPTLLDLFTHKALSIVGDPSHFLQGKGSVRMLTSEMQP